jgi:hypothetical protein
MSSTFHFADAFWFRVPLKVLVLTVTVFACLSLYPAFVEGGAGERERALFGVAVVLGFAGMAAIFAVAINDSYVELNADALYIRFESFFEAEIPARDIVRVSYIDPRPAWRYRFGLSTNFDDRISCSHGGRFVEIELARPWRTRLWPRQVLATRFWLAVREHEALIDGLRRVAPQAFTPARRELPAAA